VVEEDWGDGGGCSGGYGGVVSEYGVGEDGGVGGRRLAGVGGGGELGECVVRAEVLGGCGVRVVVVGEPVAVGVLQVVDQPG
jgi:hypothetical protein